MLPHIIIDDFTLAASSSTLEWADSGTVANSSFFNQTASTWSGDGESGFLEWRFKGTETSVYGTHSADFSYRYALLENDDGLGGTQETDVQDAVNTAIVKQYSLSEGVEHVARFTPRRGNFSLDYVLYRPLDRAPVAGLTVLVDDRDYESENTRQLVRYDGKWSTKYSTSSWPDPVFPSGTPVGETIAETNNTDASFSYTFNGSSIAVHGALHQVPGTLRIQYEVDGQTFSTTHFNGSQPDDNSWRLNQVLFRRSLGGEEFPAPDAAKPDEHTLTVRVEEVTGDQSFLFDYLTYTGTQNTIISIPKIRSFEIDRTMNAGPVAAGAIAVVLLWLWVFLGDKLPFVGSSSRARRSAPHGTVEDYNHSQPAGDSASTAKAPARV
ncbi:hypothetical protein BKA70DRAFT_2880 [Coprinopsis sp. MPI-PUGE-AT-0042]|nr:hypothetical protein BKA70DRAFT_2880 [Coprinopsis sp. MPI-PUGE-AT-0042]